MVKASIKERAAALLTLVRKLVETPGLTWVDVNNAVYAPNGPFSCLFRTEAERVAYGKTKEGRQIDDLIASLPQPPLRPWPKGEEHNGAFIPIRKSTARRSRARTATQRR